MHESHCEGEIEWTLPVDGIKVWKRGQGWEQEGSGTGRMEGEVTRREHWNLGVTLGQDRNLEQWKHTGIYEGDRSEDSQQQGI